MNAVKVQIKKNLIVIYFKFYILSSSMAIFCTFSPCKASLRSPPVAKCLILVFFSHCKQHLAVYYEFFSSSPFQALLQQLGDIFSSTGARRARIKKFQTVWRGKIWLSQTLCSHRVFFDIDIKMLFKDKNICHSYTLTYLSYRSYGVKNQPCLKSKPVDL